MDTKKDKAIIDLLEGTIVSARIFDNIEKVTLCCSLYTCAWYPIVYLMGIDLNEYSEHNEHIVDEYLKVFEDYLDKENTSEDTAVLVYNKFDEMVKKNLHQFPSLKAS